MWLFVAGKARLLSLPGRLGLFIRHGALRAGVWGTSQTAYVLRDPNDGLSDLQQALGLGLVYRPGVPE